MTRSGLLSVGNAAATPAPGTHANVSFPPRLKFGASAHSWACERPLFGLP